LIEELAAPGLELLIGVVRKPGFGLLATIGLGGTLTEALDDVAMRLCPLSADDAAAMLDGFRGSRLFEGVRGGPAVDREAVVRALLAIAGEGGLVEEVGPRLEELECNPVRATSNGVVALDARMVLRTGARGEAWAPAADFDRFFHPRAVAVAGASTSGKLSFGNRALEAYRQVGWTEGLYAVHPTARDVTGVPAYPSVADIPGGVDYLLVAVPAAACGPLLTAAAGHVPFAQVITGGFREAGAEGAAMEQDLLRTAQAAGIRIVGPNCLGVYCPKGRHSFQLDCPTDAGHVSVVSQSGGLSGDIVKAGFVRGVRFSKVVAVGNSVDVTAGELVEYLLDDEDTEVIGRYLEGADEHGRLVTALRAAAGRKPVVALVGGLTDRGAHAVASHTGALAGDRRSWGAVSASTGTTVVQTLEDLLGSLAFLQRYRESTEAGGVLVLGVGGGSSVLAADACARAGLDVAEVPAGLQDKLRERGYGLAMSVANPLEIQAGPLAPPDAWHAIVEPVLAEEPYSDLLWHVNVQPYYSYGGEGIGVLLKSIELFGENRWPATRVSIALRNLDCAPPADQQVVVDACVNARRPHFRTVDEAAVAIAAGQRFVRARNSRSARGDT
jgi:acyl-CoA synthetase (NDP forming)